MKFPFPRHVEDALFHLFTRTHQVGDVVYMMREGQPVYFRLVKRDPARDVNVLRKLGTRTMLRTDAFTVYDFDHVLVTNDVVEMGTLDLEALTVVLKDVNQPVVVACCRPQKF